MTEPISEAELQRRLAQLEAKGLSRLLPSADMRRAAELSLEIDRLKKEKNAVVAGHVYQRPEILAAAADFTGDSYRLAKLCAQTAADTIVFCGVRFMAETAKLLSPQKTVILPAPEAGCTLADSITADDVRALKAQYPGLPVITYINTAVEVKAESDCVVTSANAELILRRFYKKHPRLIFIPDALMGANLAQTLGKTPGRDIILWKGSCVVHEGFNAGVIRSYRSRYPGLKVLAHSECPPDIVRESDFAGGTSGMMAYIGKTCAAAYMLVTECGLGELALLDFPDKKFIAMCRLCPYMKLTCLEDVTAALKAPSPFQIIQNPPAETARRALAALNKMFELAG
ncbi:MAG: quinolinate synthase NadA [Elusimicrobiales bacterium]|nr:quinolinate synthase NadA [Elusimicrobiales bacterium]